MANVWGYTDFQRDGDGYTFTRSDGAEQYLFGDQADELAQRIAEEKSREMTADNGEQLPDGWPKSRASVIVGDATSGRTATDASAAPVPRQWSPGALEAEQTATQPSPASAGTFFHTPETRNAMRGVDTAIDNPVVKRSGTAAQPQRTSGGMVEIPDPNGNGTVMVDRRTGATTPGRQSASASVSGTFIPQQPQSALSMTPEQQAAYLNAPVYRPGSPGRNPQAELDSGIMVPRGAVTSRQVSGAPDTAEAQAARSENSIDQKLAAQAQAYAKAIALGEQAKAATREMELYQREMDKRRTITLRTEAAVRDNAARLRQFEDDARNGRVDPGRFFKERGTMATIIAAIMQGLGAYAAIRSKTGQNYAKQIIDAAIERDIAAQERELLTKERARDNALAELRDSLGNDELAKNMLREAMARYAESEARKLAAVAGQNAVGPDLQAYLAKRDEERIAAEKALADQQAGVTTKQVTEEFALPAAPTPGAWVAPSTKEVGDRLSNLKDIQSLADNSAGAVERQVKLLNSMTSLKNAQRVAAGGASDEQARWLAEYGKRKGGLDQVKLAMEHIAQRAGWTLLPNGEIVVPQGSENLAGMGWQQFLPTIFKGEEGKAMSAAFRNAASLMALERLGQTSTEKQDVRIEEVTEMAKGYTDADAVNGARMMWADYVAARRNLEGSFLPAIKEQYRMGSEGYRSSSQMEADSQRTGVRVVE